MGIKTESLANACSLSEGLTPDIYIKRTLTKQNNVFFIDGECSALNVALDLGIAQLHIARHIDRARAW